MRERGGEREKYHTTTTIRADGRRVSEYRDRRRAGSPNCLRCFILGGAKSVVSDRGWTRRLLLEPAAPAKGALETGKKKSFSSVGKKSLDKRAIWLRINPSATIVFLCTRSRPKTVRVL